MEIHQTGNNISLSALGSWLNCIFSSSHTFYLQKHKQKKFFFLLKHEYILTYSFIQDQESNLG